MFEIESRTQAGDQRDQDPHNSHVRPNFYLVHDFQYLRNPFSGQAFLPVPSCCFPETLF
jgi:hypothetical protein